MEAHENQPRNLLGKILAWPASFAVSLVCIFVGLSLLRTASVFADLFRGLGIDPPAPTKFLIANHAWLGPLLFGGLAVFAVAKELWITDPRRRLSSSGIVLLAALSLLGLEFFLMNLPLLDLVRKLNETK